MNIKKRINNIRRLIMQSLTKNIGKSKVHLNNRKDIIIKNILISRPNHRLGNLLLLTPLVQEVINTFPDCKIDLFVKGGLSPTIYKNYTNIDRIVQLPKKPFSNIFKYMAGWIKLRSQKYDLVINASFGSSSGKLSTFFSRSSYKMYGDLADNSFLQYEDYRHSAKNSIYNLRHFLKNFNLPISNKEIPYLDIKLSNYELEIGEKKLLNLVNNKKNTLCLFTNATGEKCFSEIWWCEFYNNLKTSFPDCNIIELLPVENISKLNFSIPFFYSKDIREMGALLANTLLFITADNGVMHLASASGVPTIGLFSVTEEEVYKPYNEFSFSINTNNFSQKEIIELIKKQYKNF